MAEHHSLRVRFDLGERDNLVGLRPVDPIPARRVAVAVAGEAILPLPEGTEMVMPGDNVELTVELITPVAMEKGLRFAIREGGHTVGAGTLSEIIK